MIDEDFLLEALPPMQDKNAIVEIEYLRFIEERKKRPNIVGYSENHHIIPKCLGGNDNLDNLIRLSGAEHYEAHLLLSKVYPLHEGLAFTIQMMQGKNKMTAIEYEEFRKLKVIAMMFSRKGQNKSNCERIRKQSITITGRTKDSHISVAAQSEALTGRTKETHEYLAEASKKMTGRTKETHEGPRKSSETQKGRTKETHEGVAKSAASRTGHTKETHDYLKVRSVNRKGQNKENCEFMKTVSEKLKKLTPEQINFLIERKQEGLNFKQIHLLLTEMKINIGYSALPQIYRREIKNWEIKNEKLI